MATQKCPACGASVKPENLERHFSSVHPRLVPPALSAEERRPARARPVTRQPLPRVRWSWIGVMAVVLLALAAGAAAMYLAGPLNQNVMRLHIHPRLSITIDGVRWEVPAYIGIEPTRWIDHSLDGFGMEGMSPLHTHDQTGLLHVESNTVRDYTIGEFFRVWGQTFDSSQVLGHPAGPGHRVRMVVDGAEMAPSYSLVLRDGMQIHIICDIG